MIGHSTPHFNETNVKKKKSFFNFQSRLKSDGDNAVVREPSSSTHSRGNFFDIPMETLFQSPCSNATPGTIDSAGLCTVTDHEYYGCVREASYFDPTSKLLRSQSNQAVMPYIGEWNDVFFSNCERLVREIKEITGENMNSPNFKLLITQSFSCLYFQPSKSPWSWWMECSVSVNPVVWRGDLPHITPSLDG